MASFLTLSSRQSLHQLRAASQRSSNLRFQASRRPSSLASKVVLSPRYCRSFATLSMDFTYPYRESTVVTVAETRPLALSVTTTLNNDEHRFVRRVVRRIQSLLQRLWEALTVSLRAAEVTIRFSPLLVLTPAAMISSKLSSQDPTRLSNLAWWYTLTQIQQLGPAFVKLAQWAATRRDIFPPVICDRFSKLHDKGTTHSWSHSDLLLKEAFGDDYEAKGLVVHRDQVIGCGSAAQVYRGTLTTAAASDDNDESTTQQRQVAVKILHPRFSHLVERDLHFFQSVAHLLHALPIETLKMLNLPRVVDNFGVILRRQADLRVEGSNLVQFRTNFCQDNQLISFPSPIDGWMDQNVLVEEFVEDAVPIAHFLSDSSEQGLATRKELAGPLLRAFLKMVFIDNFCHCDLHPGNVLVKVSSEEPSKRSSWYSSSSSDDNTAKTKLTIVFLDAGIATSLTQNDKRNLKDLFRAVILNDGNQAGRLMVERAKYERCSQVEGGIDAFASGVEEIVSEFHDRRKQGLTLGAVRIGGLLSRVLDLCREHGVEIDPDMANIVISTLVLEGLGRSLHPDLNLIDCAVPFVLGRGKVR